MSQLQILQNKVTKGLLELSLRSSAIPALSTAYSWNLYLIEDFFIDMWLCINGETGFNFRSNASLHSYNIRRKNELNLPSARTNWGKQKFIYHAAKDWNNFDENFRNIPL